MASKKGLTLEMLASIEAALEERRAERRQNTTGPYLGRERRSGNDRRRATRAQDAAPASNDPTAT